MRIQTFLATVTPQTAEGLIAAVLRLPEDKRNWQPEPSSRSALDQVAECVLLTDYVAELIQTRQGRFTSFEAYGRAKEEAVAGGWESLKTALQNTMSQISAVLEAVPDEVLNEEVATLVGPQTITQLMTYPYWNMTYHQGQINYIASLLNRLL